jgi:hypothetical protein
MHATQAYGKRKVHILHSIKQNVCQTLFQAPALEPRALEGSPNEHKSSTQNYISIAPQYFLNINMD